MDGSVTHNGATAAPFSGPGPAAAWGKAVPSPAGASIAFPAFDTGCTITAYGDPAAMREALQAARDACREYEGLFSRTLPSSDIGRLNSAASAAVEVDPRTYGLLQAACGYCAASQGAFDITVGALSDLWDFKEGRIPSPEVRARAAAHVGWQGLELQRDGASRCRARLADGDARVDLGGIAKGWIADELGGALMQAGARGAVLNLGGNVLVRGSKPDGSPWRVALRCPAGRWPGAAPTVTLEEGSVVTSGTYERCFRSAGRLYHHIMDPRTGLPVETPWASVSVLAARSIDAEGFSTTLLALGPEGGCRLAEAHPEILQAWFIAPDGAVQPLRKRKAGAAAGLPGR